MASDRADQRFKEGYRLYNQGKYEQALTLLEEAIQISPLSIKAWFANNHALLLNRY